MSMESPKSLFVPEEKRAAFEAAERSGTVLRSEQARLELEADKRSDGFKEKTADAVELAGIGVGGAVLGVDFHGGVKAVYEAIKSGAQAVGLRKQEQKLSDEAERVKAAADINFTISRSIVEDEMKRSGAVEVDGRLQAAPEQIEAARREMREKYG